MKTNEDGTIVVKSLNGAELLERTSYGSYIIKEQLDPGLLYTVKLDFDYGTVEKGTVYRIKGVFDRQNQDITVFGWLFFTEYYEELN